MSAIENSWEVEVEVALRMAVYRQSVCLGVEPLETHDQNFSPNESLWYKSLLNILSDEKMGLSVINMFAFRQVYISLI
jgi:hypothetical protein